MQMVMFMKENGSTTKHMVGELTHMQMELTTMGIGLMINSMDMARSHGQMELNTLESIKMVRKTVKGD